MNGYVEAGYVVVLGTLGTYSVSLLARERAARRRVGVSRRAAGARQPAAAAAPDAPAPTAPIDTAMPLHRQMATRSRAPKPRRAAAPSDEPASRALP